MTQPNWAKRAKRARLSLGLKQPQFADVMGVHWTTVSRWENGHSLPRARDRKALDTILRDAAGMPKEA